MLRKRNCISFIAILVVILACTGCAITPQQAAMVPSELNIKNQASLPVIVKVKGDARYEDEIQISSKQLAGAIQEAIVKSNLFSKSTDGNEARYELMVEVLGFNPPRGVGFNFVSVMTTHWKLTKLPDQQVVFEDFIKKSHQATVGDAIVALVRWRMANEGAARDTVAAGLEKISQIQLQ